MAAIHVIPATQKKPPRDLTVIAATKTDLDADVIQLRAPRRRPLSIGIRIVVSPNGAVRLKIGGAK